MATNKEPDQSSHDQGAQGLAPSGRAPEQSSRARALLNLIEQPGLLETYQVKIGGKSNEELLIELKNHHKIYSSNNARSMLASPKFTTQSQVETVDIITLQVKDLGFTSAPITQELFARAEELGLELAPAETAAYLALQLADNPPSHKFSLAIEPTTVPDGFQEVFNFVPDRDGVRLYPTLAAPSHSWPLEGRVSFRFRK
jgi:hypothetical protein